MATVKFRIDKVTDPKKEVTINVRFNIDRDHRIELSSAERIPVKYWDPVKQEVKTSFRGSVEINQSLLRIKNDLIELWRHNKSASLSDLKEKARCIIRFGSDVTSKKKNDLEQFVQDFIKRIQDGKIDRRYGTLKAYRHTLRNLQKFSKKSGYDLSFNAITMEWYFDYCGWCWDDRLYEDSTVGKEIKHLKTWMRDAMDMGLHSNTVFQRKQFKKPDSETDSIYLTEEEILKIYNTNLSGSPNLLESRDLFVFACWVGLRYSDLKNIRPNHIQNGTIRITTVKTGEDVVIPLHYIAQEIYKKYGNEIPPIKSNQNFNYDLKVICQKAELNAKVQSRSTVRGVPSFEWLDKHEMVTAHTARRSFATNCYKMGVPTRSIMAITGHKTEKAFEKYIKLSKEEHANIMMEHFNQSFKAQMKVSA